MRVIVTGGRDFNDWEWFAARMSAARKALKITHITSVDDTGIGGMARFSAKLAGLPWDDDFLKRPDLIIAGPDEGESRALLDAAHKRGIRVILLEKVESPVTPNPASGSPSYSVQR